MSFGNGRDDDGVVVERASVGDAERHTIHMRQAKGARRQDLNRLPGQHTGEVDGEDRIVGMCGVAAVEDEQAVVSGNRPFDIDLLDHCRDRRVQPRKVEDVDTAYLAAVGEPTSAPRRRFAVDPDPSASSVLGACAAGSSSKTSKSGFAALRIAASAGMTSGSSRTNRPGASFSDEKTARLHSSSPTM